MKYLVLLAVIILLAGCTPINTNVTKEYVIYEENKNPELCFTPTNDCGKLLESYIRNASIVKCAFYDLDLDYLIKALEEKNAEVVIEDKNALKEFYSNYSYALMHNKFCILDNEIIITGSMNPTNNGVYKNNNNLIIIYSKYLARNYLDEFDELKKGIYGKGEEVEYPKIYLNNKRIENYFCPEDDCKEKIITELENAKESIYFMFFSFTDEDIADELIYQSKRIDVKGIVEKRRVNMKYNKYKYIRYYDVDVIPDSNPAVMHHKVFIIDEKIVITGSFNPTGAANTKNDENILIIEDERIAKEFLDEFHNIFK